MPVVQQKRTMRALWVGWAVFRGKEVTSLVLSTPSPSLQAGMVMNMPFTEGIINTLRSGCITPDSGRLENFPSACSMVNSMAVPKFRKYYIKGDILPFEEDNKNEFKGHLNLCKEEIPHWALAKKTEKPSRRPISRNLNAFLNSGTGGTIFLGVVDNGKILGFRMTRLQRDHFLKALEDLLSRYNPPVLSHQYSVRFSPVFNKTVSPEDISQRLDLITSEEVPDMYKDRKHILRLHQYCWCDKDSAATYNMTNSEGQEFVVEVIIKPWDPADLRHPAVGERSHVDQAVSKDLGSQVTEDRDDGSGIRFQPYYSDEEGKVYFRRQASVVQYNLNSIAQITKQEVKERYEQHIKRLQQECQQLEEEKARAQQQTQAAS